VSRDGKQNVARENALNRGLWGGWSWREGRAVAAAETVESVDMWFPPVKTICLAAESVAA